MKRVDFYVVKGQQERDREVFACRLTEKAYKQGNNIVLRTSGEAQTYALDNLLWSFSQGSFIPHSTDQGDSESPVHISHRLSNDSTADVLINLNDEMPADLKTITRVAEIVNEDPQIRALARQRYKQYRDEGFEVSSHNVGN